MYLTQPFWTTHAENFPISLPHRRDQLWQVQSTSTYFSVYSFYSSTAMTKRPIYFHIMTPIDQSHSVQSVAENRQIINLLTVFCFRIQFNHHRLRQQRLTMTKKKILTSAASTLSRKQRSIGKCRKGRREESGNLSKETSTLPTH